MAKCRIENAGVGVLDLITDGVMCPQVQALSLSSM